MAQVNKDLHYSVRIRIKRKIFSLVMDGPSFAKMYETNNVPIPLLDELAATKDFEPFIGDYTDEVCFMGASPILPRNSEVPSTPESAGTAAVPKSQASHHRVESEMEIENDGQEKIGYLIVGF